MRLAIIGGRNFSDYPLLIQNMHLLHNDAQYGLDIDEIVSGGAKGADSLGARWAKEHNVKLTEYLPDWDLYGKRAGFIRNQTIIENCDMVLSFWDGISRGTANSLSIAKRLKKPTLIIYF